jgi:hypothetical protein
VLATPLFKSPILYFWEMSGTLDSNQRASVANRCATNLATHLPKTLFHLYFIIMYNDCYGKHCVTSVDEIHHISTK